MAILRLSKLAATLAAGLFIASASAQTSDLSSITGSITGSVPSPTASSLSSPTSSSEPTVHLIKAGAGGFKFTPQSISNVSIGDIITFEFYPPDHSVARAEYGSACVPYEYTGRNKVGFWSTTQWVDTVDEVTHWNLTINSTEPIFFYCAAPNSCKGQLMVGAINPNGTQTLDAQIRSAKDSDLQLAPGEAIPKEASSSLANAPTSAPLTPPPAPATSSHKLSGGAIAGIVVGAVAFLVICAALFFFVGRSKSLKEVIKRQDATVRNSTPAPGPEMGGYGHHAYAQPAHPSPNPYSHSPQPEYPNSPPLYGQHNVAEQYPSGWGSPQPQQGHMSMMSTMTQQQIDEVKAAQAQQQLHAAELHSPQAQQYTAELEAPQKGPHPH